MVVPARHVHKHIQGEDMGERKVHVFRRGNTIIEVVEPPPMTQEEIDRVLDDMHAAGWAIIEELVERGESV